MDMYQKDAKKDVNNNYNDNPSNTVSCDNQDF